MKRNLLVKLLLVLLMVCATLFCFTACAEDGKDGVTPTIEISEDGYWVINGTKTETKAVSQDGVSVEEIYVGEDGHLYVKLTGDTTARDLGLVASLSPEQEGYSKGLVYQVNEDRTGYVITGLGTNTDKVLKIPETYNGLPVTGFSFVDMNYEDTYVEKIVISKNFKLHEEYDGGIDYEWDFLGFLDGVKEIDVAEDSLYYKCVDGVLYTKDGKTMFYYPKNKQDRVFVVPEGVETIEGVHYYGSNAFLEQIILPTTLKEIGFDAFNGFKSLKKVEIPDGVTSIGGYAFEYCTSLTSIIIPDSVTSIGYDAFARCSSLTSVVIGKSVTSIGEGAFDDCYRLAEVYNKSSLNIIKGNYEKHGQVGYYALSVYTQPYISKLSTNIDGYVIYTDGEDKILVGYLGKETDLVLPNGITAIKDYAFAGCNTITSVVIPNSIGYERTGDYMFSYCYSLTSITFNGTVEEWKNAHGHYYPYYWYDCPAEYVQCTDGKVEIK